MAQYLRGDEIPACVHRVALRRGGPDNIEPAPESDDVARRRRAAQEHRRDVLRALSREQTDAKIAHDDEESASLMTRGCDVIITSHLAPDEAGVRLAHVQALVRVGRAERGFTYAPLLIKNHEVVGTSRARHVLAGTLERIRPQDAVVAQGLGVRSSQSMTRTGLALAHATRVLSSLGHGDLESRGGIIDRHGDLWWISLSDPSLTKINLEAYDRLYLERLEVLRAHEQWRREGGPFPTQSYWHRDCPDCPYRAYCADGLEKRDDVSLVRFTTREQQMVLRDRGVATRARLAQLDSARAHHGAGGPTDLVGVEEELARSISKLDELIFRARVHVRGTPLRIVESDRLGCPRADVEVDVDMESNGSAAYLWGGLVTSRAGSKQVSEGYRAFVEWGELSREAEAANFAEFWKWLLNVRSSALERGLTFAAYCFWAHAENRAMDRAVSAPRPGGPTLHDLEAFRTGHPSQWIDVHETVKSQVQTAGPLGLKQLATYAGFRWRDPTPGGEASLAWYEEAVRDDSPAAHGARQRLLEYNEDDCRATRSLRDWLDGPARTLPSRYDVP